MFKLIKIDGEIKISKNVDGVTSNEDFNFTKLTKDGQAVNENHGNVQFDAQGSSSFTLKHGKVFTNIPKGIHYEISETGATGYTVSINKDGQKTTGNTITGSVQANKQAVIEFVNEKNLQN